MITKEEVQAAIEATTFLFSTSETERMLDALNVTHPAERVEWYNVAADLDVDDVVRLANVEFNASPCGVCGNMILVGRPENWDEFQGVLQDEHGPITIDGREIVVCGECYGRTPQEVNDDD